jgi:cytochrome c oxidase subunit III
MAVARARADAGRSGRVNASSAQPIAWRQIEDRRGQAAMLCFIGTEAMLFVMLFFAYYYLGHDAPDWAAEPPKMTMAFVMLAVLMSSSLVLHWGERQIDKARTGAAKAAAAGTAILGMMFLAMQVVEYRERLLEIRPDTDAYGSMFYLITSVHAAHVVLGVLMLVYVLMLPEIGRNRKPPHQPLRTAALYWHFVDVVWVVIVALIYVAPNLARWGLR